MTIKLSLTGRTPTAGLEGQRNLEGSRHRKSTEEMPGVPLEGGVWSRDPSVQEGSQGSLRGCEVV